MGTPLSKNQGECTYMQHQFFRNAKVHPKKRDWLLEELIFLMATQKERLMERHREEVERMGAKLQDELVDKELRLQQDRLECGAAKTKR